MEKFNSYREIALMQKEDYDVLRSRVNDIQEGIEQLQSKYYTFFPIFLNKLLI